MATPRWPAEDLDKLRHLWNERALSGQQISDQFGGRYSRKAVIGKARRENLDSRSSTVNRHLGGKPRATPKLKSIPSHAPLPMGPLGDFGSGCKWPAQMLPEYQECGHDRVSGKNYCAYHHSIAYDRSKLLKTADQINRTATAARVFR